MRLILSLSGELKRLCNLEADTAFSGFSQLGGHALLSSHSTQVSWSLHCAKVGDGYIVTCVESYSAYTLFLAFSQIPSWEQLYQGFLQAYADETRLCLEQGGFVGWHQRSVFERNFQAMGTPEIVCGVQTEARQRIESSQQWMVENLSDALSSCSGEGSADEVLRRLGRTVNYLPQKHRVSRGEEIYFPLERFLSDSLYRFASGLCDVDIPGCKAGAFPNPHRTNAELRVVPC